MTQLHGLKAATSAGSRASLATLADSFSFSLSAFSFSLACCVVMGADVPSSAVLVCAWAVAHKKSTASVIAYLLFIVRVLYGVVLNILFT